MFAGMLPFCFFLLFLLTPSRWFAGGKGLDFFREGMLKRKDISLIKHYENSKDVFKDVSIAGGVSYFVIDKTYSGKCRFNGKEVDLSKHDILITETNFNSILNKVKNKKLKTIDSLCTSSSFTGIQTNDERLRSSKPNDDYIVCYSNQRTGFKNFIHKKHVKPEFNMKTYKVIITEAGENDFGKMFICRPGEIFTQTYLSFEFSSLTKAKNFISYLKCDLPTFLFRLRKISQHSKPDTFKYIPIMNFNTPWDNQKVNNFFSLTNSEISRIKK